MNRKAEHLVIDALLTHLDQRLCSAMLENLAAAAQDAWLETKSHHEGNLPYALGQARHFHSNEQFAMALDMTGITHNPVCGNDIVIGQAGPLLLGRFSTKDRGWENARRSSLRRKLASHNAWIERLAQPGLFIEHLSRAHMAVFFVSVFSGNMHVQPERPLSIEIAVMDTSLSERLVSEPLVQFLTRYANPAEQPDLVRVRLKKRLGKQQDSQS